LQTVTGTALETIDIKAFVIDKLLHRSEFHLWFVYAILGIYLIIPILRRWLQNAPKSEIHYFLIIWLITMFFKIPKVGAYQPAISLAYFAEFIGYVVLGYYLVTFEMKVIKNKWFLPSILTFLGIGLTIVLTFIFTLKQGYFYEYFYGYLTPNVLLASVGIFLLIKNTKAPKNPFFKKVIDKLNQYSYGIYLAHFLILKLLEYHGYDWQFINPIISVPLITIVCLLVSYLIVWLFNRFKFGKYLVG
jgi:surface polysaccharide O-acyltransferase-like enzyme